MALYIKSIVRNTFPGKPEWRPERDIKYSSNEDDEEKQLKVIFITGGNSGIGKETIIQVLKYGNKYKNIKFYLGARDEEKAIEAINEIEIKTKFKPIFHELDLSDLNKVIESAKRFKKLESNLHGLILNAGVMIPPIKSTTKQNYDYQFGVNVIGHFVWFKWMVPLLVNASKILNEPSRVAWISSAASILQGNVAINYNSIIDGPQRMKLNPVRLYFQSKLGDVFLSMAISKKFPSNEIISVSIDPGNIRTDLYKYSPIGQFATKIFKYLFLFPVYYGALSSTYFLTIPSNQAIKLNGKFLAPWGKIDSPNPQALVMDNYMKLYDYCQHQTAPFLPHDDDD